MDCWVMIGSIPFNISTPSHSAMGRMLLMEHRFPHLVCFNWQILTLPGKLQKNLTSELNWDSCRDSRWS